MTTPGGVPNLPMGALTIDTLESKTQDMSTTAMKSRAVERFPSIFNSSTGLDPSLDITPFGILTAIWSGFNSQVANADPADVQGPDDLPGLLLQFIEGLPVIGQFVDLLDAILGTYTGDDATLLTVQAIFAPIRAIVDALTAVAGGTGGLTNFFPDLLGLLGNPTGLGTGSVDITGWAEGFVNDILNPTGLLASVSGIVEAITGVGGDLTDLSSFFSALPFLDDIVDAITGTTGGGLPDLASFFTGFAGGGSLLDQLVGSITGSAGGLTDLTGFFTSFFGIFGGATSLGQAGNFFTNLLSMLNTPALTGSPGSFNPSTALSGLITGLINPLGLLAPLSGGTVPTTNIPTLPDTKVPGLGSWVDTIFNSLTGQGLSGVFQADAGGQIAELAGTVSSLGAAVANLINLGDAASNSGLRGLDDLERTSSTNLGSTLWAQNYSGGTSGVWATPTGHTAKWLTGSGVRTGFARRTDPGDAVTQTDYQKVGMTIGSQIITQNGFFSSSPNVENSILLRQSADGSQYVRARVKNDQAQFFYKNGGAETALGSPVSTTHAAGVNFYGIAGTAGNIRTFQLIRNTSPILTVTDNTSVTALGVSNRGWGATATADSSDVPSEVAQFTVADNTPVAVVGTTMRVYRGTTTGITKSSGEGPLPANTFDTVDYISADMTWNASTSTLTVTKAGTYLFSGRFEMSNPIGFSEELYPIVQVGGVTRARGGARRGISINGFGFPSAPQDRSAGGDAMMLYLQANATVRFGFSATASNTVIGDASGHKTWFAATKLG